MSAEIAQAVSEANTRAHEAMIAQAQAGYDLAKADGNEGAMAIFRDLLKNLKKENAVEE